MPSNAQWTPDDPSPNDHVIASRAKDGPPWSRHHKGTIRPGIGPHWAVHAGTLSSTNGREWYRPVPGVRIDTEEVTSSILVSPTM